jgi:hypothetical protein
MLCLTCHDALQDVSRVTPHVLNGHEELAGGSFTAALDSDNVGHNIQSIDLTLDLTPPGGVPMSEFSCLSCHDPHDNGNFRNLKREINGYPTLVRAIGDPTYKRNVYVSGMSQFCAACHEQFYGTNNTGGGVAWTRHPVEIPIAGAVHADFQAWSTRETKVTRVENPSGDPNDLHGAQVFCLSCHRAHASSFKDALLWDYDKTSEGCQECHNM